MELTQDDVIHILKLINEAPVGRFRLQVGDLKLEVVKGTARDEISEARTSPPAVVRIDEADRAEAVPATREEPDRAESAVVDVAEENLLSIKAPLLGIFYRQSQPGAPPYVEEGSVVEEDATVALIEVMKLFNPVKAGVRGRIHRICVENGTLVEYGQVLFLVKAE